MDFAKLISYLFHSRTQAHIFHLQTQSFAEHMALNVYYDGIVPLIDGIVESYQGKYGIVKGYSNFNLMEYNNTQQVVAYLDNPDTFHRICFRFTDGTLLIPVKELAGLMPEFNVRHDTNERDLVVRVNAMMFKRYWLDVVIKE